MGRDEAGEGEIAGVAAHVFDGPRHQDTGRRVALVSSLLHGTGVILIDTGGDLLQALQLLELLLDDIVLAEERFIHLDLVETVLSQGDTGPLHLLSTRRKAANPRHLVLLESGLGMPDGFPGGREIQKDRIRNVLFSGKPVLTDILVVDRYK